MFYPESNIAQPTDYGIYGNSTPGEVAQDRQGDTPTFEKEKSALDEKLMQLGGGRDEPGRGDRGRGEPEIDR